jgi:predicted DNA-binding transcriptional regulator YafY
MRPADRLFQIVLLLGRGRVLTARILADRLEVSERTIYRDIQDLIGFGLYRSRAKPASVTACGAATRFRR